jgi:ABC-type phosphate/phosphonate transport system permease subunit
MDEVMETIQDSFQHMANELFISAFGGLLICFAVAFVLGFVLKQISRHIVYIPAKTIEQICRFAAALVMFYAMMKIYLFRNMQ